MPHGSLQWNDTTAKTPVTAKVTIYYYLLVADLTVVLSSN